MQRSASYREEQRRMEATVERAYLRYSEAETYTGLHRVTLWRAVRRGQLKPSGYGSAVRFRVEDLDRFMSSKDAGEEPLEQ